MSLNKLLTHELSLVLIVKFILLYLLWFLFFSQPEIVNDKKKIVQHVFGEVSDKAKHSIELPRVKE